MFVAGGSDEKANVPDVIKMWRSMPGDFASSPLHEQFTALFICELAPIVYPGGFDHWPILRREAKSGNYLVTVGRAAERARFDFVAGG